MAKTRRAYEGAGASTTLNGAFAAAATTLSVAAATGWPYGSDPFFIVIEPGTSNEEKILVTRTNSGDLTLTVSGSRGADGTTDVTHADGSTVYPVFTATDADEANELASTWTTKGDIVTHGASTFERLAVGTDDYALLADSTASGGVAWGQVPTAGIANDAVTTAKIAADAVTATELADNAVVTANIVDGSVTTAKIGADAVDGTKIADNAIGSEHIAAGAVGSSELASTTVTAGTYGDSANVAEITIDVDGRITSATETAITIDSSTVSDATSANTANKIVKRNSTGGFNAGTISATFSGNLTGNVTGNVTGNASTATTLATARNFSISGDITAANKSFDGSGNVALSASIDDGVVDTAQLADGAVTTAKLDTGQRLKTGYQNVTTDGDGYFTIAHGLGSTGANKPVFLNPVGTLSNGNDTLFVCVPTQIDGTYIYGRAYEFDGSTTSNSGNTVSSIISATLPLAWMVVY